MYAAIYTWSDIVFTLNWLSQYLSNSAEHHEYTLKKLLQYVRLIINLSIMYSSSESQAMLEYSDSDYALNKQNQKSILEHIYMLKDESVLWASQKQKFIVILITEVKYIIMSMCVKTEIWLEQMLRDMSISKYLEVNSHCMNIQENKAHQTSSLIQLKRDNQVILTLIKNAHVHEQSKYIDVFYHNICNLHKHNQIQVDFVLSQEMVVNRLIKPLPRQIFEWFIEFMKFTVDD